MNKEKEIITNEVKDTSKKEGFMAWMKAHKVVAVIIIALALLCVYRIGSFVYDSVNKTAEDEALTAVKVTTAEYATISKATPMSGRISAVEEAAIYPMGQGKITAVHVKVGDYVKKGTLLFNIDSSAVSGTFQQAKAAYDVAKTSYNNMTVLYQEGAISKADYDSAKVQYTAAQSSYQLASTQMSYYNVTAPIDGYVTSLNVSVGNMAASSQMAASISNTEALQIETTASEYVAGLLHAGDEVEVTVSNLEGKVFTGKVDTISPAPALGTYTYPLTISLDNTSGELMSGMFAEISVKAEESKDALCVPSDSVIMKNGQTIVVVVDKDNVATFHEVTTGIDNGEMVEILSGVKQGDTVVCSGMDFVSDGATVNVK